MLFAGGPFAGPASGQPEAEAEGRPVLVELFTSQGCGLCPEANRYLGELDQRDNVFVLAFGVSYWDMYGWADTYARPEYVQRQRTYLPRLGVNRLYTPASYTSLTLPTNREVDAAGAVVASQQRTHHITQ